MTILALGASRSSLPRHQRGEEMSVERRVVVVHGDARLRDRIRQRFAPPEFEFHGFGDGCDALLVLDELRPDLIMSDSAIPDMDGWLFSQVVKRSPALKEVPLLFFSTESFDLADLETRAREALRLPQGQAEVPMPVAGASDDFFDMLLAHEAAVARVAVREGPDVPAPKVPFEGRFSKVEVEGRTIRILTEAHSRPTFMVVTAIERDGHKMRRIETAWPHPLDRFEDGPLVRREIDLQHDRILATVGSLLVEAPRRPAGAEVHHAVAELRGEERD
jgi:CheY-like chemotaxis protein